MPSANGDENVVWGILRSHVVKLGHPSGANKGPYTFAYPFDWWKHVNTLSTSGHTVRGQNVICGITCVERALARSLHSAVLEGEAIVGQVLQGWAAPRGQEWVSPWLKTGLTSVKNAKIAVLSLSFMVCG